MKRIFMIALLVGFTGLIAEEAQNSTPSTKIQFLSEIDVRSVGCDSEALEKLYLRAFDQNSAQEVILKEFDRCIERVKEYENYGKGRQHLNASRYDKKALERGKQKLKSLKLVDPKIGMLERLKKFFNL